MTNVDQFESVFKAATKTSFAYRAIEIGKVLLVTDLDEDPAQQLSDQVRTFLRVLGEDKSVNWRTIQGDKSRPSKNFWIWLKRKVPT